MGVALLKVFWFHFEGTKYLKHIVKPVIKEIFAETKNNSLEIDILYVKDPDLVLKNVSKLISFTRKFLNDFLHSTNMFPLQFAEILWQLYSHLSKVVSSKSHLGLGYSEQALRLVGAFLMLRFICPAIVSPHKFHLVKAKTLTEQTQRGLVLVSKILQNIANNVEFQGEKEPYMMKTNGFVLEQMPEMLFFLHTLLVERFRPLDEQEKNSDVTGLE